MASKFSAFDRLLLPLRSVHPALWLALALLALALAGGWQMRRQVEETRLLQDRLTGAALVDALRAYAAASGDKHPPRPLRLEELAHDSRDGETREWIDTASLESLGDVGHWRLVRDADGRVRGAQSRIRQDLLFTLDDPPGTPTIAQDRPTLLFPHPLLPDTHILRPPAMPDRIAGSGDAPAAARGAVSRDAPTALKASPSIASLESKQVLRLSSAHGDDAPTITLHKPRVHAVRVVPTSPAGAGKATAMPPGGGRHAAPDLASRARTAAEAGAASKAALPNGTVGKPGPAPATSARSAAPDRAESPPAQARVDLPPAAPLLALPAPELRPKPEVGAATPAAAPPSAAVPVAPPPADAVSFEVNQGIAAHPAKGDCRGLAGDSTECDGFELSDPELYQRCYQSLSERINACVSGELVPPLITHRD